MKKKLFCLLLVLILPISLLFVGCGSDSNNKTMINNSSIGQTDEDQVNFIIVGSIGAVGYKKYIYVNKATKVMYLIDENGEAITVMVNPDGTPMIFQGNLDEYPNIN